MSEIHLKSVIPWGKDIFTACHKDYSDDKEITVTEDIEEVTCQECIENYNEIKKNTELFREGHSWMKVNLDASILCECGWVTLLSEDKEAIHCLNSECPNYKLYKIKYELPKIELKQKWYIRGQGKWKLE